MQFPHLSDTQFPNLSTVNVYQFQNNFDYTRWNEKTKIKLCNVIWNSDYTDVVKWDTNEARDAWFDSLADYWAIELRTSARLVPEGYVKLPIPYDVMARYNYLFIDMPIATSADNPIDYENDEGVRRWYFFVNDIRYLAPNATQVFVVPDVWTNFQNDVDITYMLLERGHAPVAASDVDAYLANPIENNRYLLAPDVNFDNAGITRSSSFVPFGNGTKWVCLASTCAPNQIASLGTVTTNSAYDPSGTITYSDVDVRYGHQLQVNGYGIGNGRDYSAARTPARAGFSDGLIANNLTVYAIRAYDCYGEGTFFTDVMQQCPQFLTTVQACFVVDDACITRGQSYQIASHTVYRCEGRARTLLDKALNVADFGYPQELRRFAKLYTAPYAKLEITDNDGITYDVNIEETSTLSVKSVVSVAFPYVNERVYVDGIGGTGSRSYTWVDLNGNLDTLGMSDSDWFKYCFDWRIPTFALFMDGETAFMLESFNRNVRQALNQGLVSYHNSMRSANTAYENACDQADVAYYNTVRNAYAALGNAERSADTGKANADDAADTAYANVDRTCTMQRTNLGTQTATTAANEEDAMLAEISITGTNQLIQLESMQQSNAMVLYTTAANIERSTAATMGSAIATIAGDVVSGAASGAVIGASGGPYGAIGGAIIGGVGGTINATAAVINNGITTNTNQSIAQKQIDANYAIYRVQNEGIITGGSTFTRSIVQDKTDVRTRTYQRNNTSAITQMDNANATTRTNAAASRDTAKANATRTQTTSKANANDTYTATVTGAGNTRQNVRDNAGYTRQVGELNAKEILENGKNAAMAAILDARNAAPVEVCQYGGNPQADYMRTRGVQIKVKTQSDSAIRQAGDTFARFGYALNQVWDVASSGLKLMRHFTYWKAAEIWVDDRQSSNNAVNNFIHNLFLNGVTVWNDPTEIGRVNVYDN